MKSDRIFWAALVLVSIGVTVLVVGSQKDVNNVSAESIAQVEVKDSTARDTYERFYYPNENEVNALIREASKFQEYDMENYMRDQRLPLKENKLRTAADHPPFVTLFSPWASIVRSADAAYQRMETPSPTDVRADAGDRTLSFLTESYRLPTEASSDFHVVLRQGDFVLQPAGEYEADSIDGNSMYDSGRDMKKTKERYIRENGHVIFWVGDQIDFEQPAELVFLFNGKDDYAVYELDFQKFIR
ncbi:hypothetical protein [Saccharibacillus brassicae]|nr:hypothetical protein [Saccharibacillus brassicae]